MRKTILFSTVARSPETETGAALVEKPSSADVETEEEEEADEAETMDVSIQSANVGGNEMALRAIKLAEKTVADDKFNGHNDEAIKANETAKKGPVLMALDMARIYTAEEIGRFPKPGLKQDDAGNLPYDRYTAKVLVDGELKNRPGSFYSDFVWHTKRGKEIREALAKVNEKLVKAKAPGDTARKRQLEAQAQTVRKNVVKGIRILHMTTEINRVLPDLVVDFVWQEGKEPVYNKETGALEKEGELLNTPACILIWKPGKPGAVLTVDSFITLKPETAKANGGGVANLTATSGKKGKKKQATASNLPEINSKEEMEQHVAIWANFAQKQNSFSMAVAEFQKENNDDFLLSFNEAALFFDGLYPQAKPYIERALARKSAAETQKRDAEKNAKRKTATAS